MQLRKYFGNSYRPNGKPSGSRRRLLRKPTATVPEYKTGFRRTLLKQIKKPVDCIKRIAPFRWMKWRLFRQEQELAELDMGPAGSFTVIDTESTPPPPMESTLNAEMESVMDNGDSLLEEDSGCSTTSESPVDEKMGCVEVEQEQDEITQFCLTLVPLMKPITTLTEEKQRKVQEKIQKRVTEIVKQSCKV